MSTVNITVGPRTYPVACGDGEEDQVEKLASLINEKYEKLGNARSPRESHNLVFTALFLADELTEARKKSSEGDNPTKPAELTSSMDRPDLKAEIQLLRNANEALKGELEEMREGLSEKNEAVLGSDRNNDALAEKLEALAARAEATAAALEGPESRA